MNEKKSGLFDYIKWRGDLTFSQVEFNEIDALILSELSYLKMKGIISSQLAKDGISLTEAANKFFNSPDVIERSDMGLFLNDNLIELLKKTANSKRFGSAKLSGFVESTDLVKEKQFAAFTAMLEDRSLFISFRGTDDSLIGWKEDFNMAFTTPVPSQKEALHYLEQVALLPGKIRLGGHSKGGNLAVYSATFCNKKLKRRILGVYSNDGPGFEFDITKRPEFAEISDKIHTFVPQTSIVGVLLEHEEDHIVVKSHETGLMQHDPFSWQLDGPKFLVLDSLSNQGLIIDKTIKEWLKSMNSLQREQFVDALFEVITSSEATTVSELSEKWIHNPVSALKSLLALDEGTRRVVWNALQQLFRTAKTNIPALSGLFFKGRDESPETKELPKEV
ncbi:MAG: DUF2974 domain-containing protein [Spirochaetaceae bacterium]|nr:DUF2974 domain-containing protein [Spirochaetaceae bacterium]